MSEVGLLEASTKNNCFEESTNQKNMQDITQRQLCEQFSIS